MMIQKLDAFCLGNCLFLIRCENLIVLMILLFSGLRGLIELVAIVLTRHIRDLKFDINIFG